MVRAGALFVLLSIGCAPAAAPPGEAIQTRDDTDHGVITDVSDTCGVLRPGCPGIEDDGCPDVIVEIERGCEHERTRALIAELVQAMKKEPRFTRVTVRGDPTLAACIAGRVTAQAIETSRVEAVNDKLPYVSFEVTAWDGAACR